ncbi:MAG: alpha/beta hydrolase [Desulfovibrionales bacterium]
MKYLALALFFYALYCSLLFVQQRRIMYPRYLIPEPGEVRLQHGERVWLELPFGKVEAWYLPPEHGRGPAPAVIFAHGNAELIDFYPREMHWFLEQGMGLFLVEYPGYGRSEGSPSRGSLRKTFAATYDHLVSRKDVDQDRIIFLGRSIGSAVVCDLAGSRPSRGMVLIAPFTSVRAMARSYLVPPFLIRDRFDNVRAVRGYGQPLLVVHGEGDSIIPPSHGRAVAEAAPQGRLALYACDHNDCPPDWDIFFRDVAALLQRAGVLERSPD